MQRTTPGGGLTKGTISGTKDHVTKPIHSLFSQITVLRLYYDVAFCDG
jgi:hypothetical protein